MDIPGTILQEAFAHAAATWPEECCACVIQDAQGLRYVKMRNIAQRPQEDFEPHPDDLAGAEDAGEPVLLVHSHVLSGVRPSIADRTACEETGLPWLIVNREGATHLIEPCGYKAPLEGRPYRYGIHDCATLLRDWYATEKGLYVEIPHSTYGWWQRGENLYEDHLRAAGFAEVQNRNKLQRGDILLFITEGSTPHHAAVFLGDGYVLQHLRDRDSAKTTYGHYWRVRTHSAWRLACE